MRCSTYTWKRLSASSPNRYGCLARRACQTLAPRNRFLVEASRRRSFVENGERTAWLVVCAESYFQRRTASTPKLLRESFPTLPCRIPSPAYTDKCYRRPQMDVDALLAAFRRLQTNESRSKGLAALVQELTPYEWRDLHKLTAARSFQFDIIGKLPVEIVAQIFTHLEPTAPYLLQRVSSQWRHVLRSTDILASSLYAWSGRVTNLQVATLTQCEHKAKRMQEFRQGKPDRLFSIHHHEPHGRVMLVEDTLIWSCIVLPDSKARMVYVLNIKSWNLRKLQGDARETVYRLFASDQLVGFASNSNVCYVWTLDGYEKRKFRVHNSALFQSITCRDSTVACAGCLNDHALVYVWNYETQRGASFTVAFDTALFVYPVPG
jgi:hypothetical protein